MTLKLLDKSDIEAICKVQESFADGWNCEMLKSAFENKSFYAYGAFNEQGMCGFITYSVAGEDVDIGDIFVLEKYRKQGVGSKLLQKCFKQAKSLSADKIFLEVRKSNSKAISFYTKFGFNEISQRKKYYSDGEDALVMLKEI